MKKSLIRIGCFLVILSLILCYSNSVFKLKQIHGIYNLTKFYEQDKNSIDVLILGSSHAYQNINTGILWDEYGMATYILAGAAQPLWNTYYYLKEALKSQKPKVIVLEGFFTLYSPEFQEKQYIIFNNFGLRWSLNKIESIKTSAPREDWGGLLLEYTQYHTRYKELTREDFFRNQGNPLYDDWKGFYCNMLTTPFTAEDVSGVEERLELPEKSEKYYRAIIELSKENEIPIVVVISPFSAITTDFQKYFNKVGDIAEEMGVPFLNTNLDLAEMGLDFSTDAADTDHLNYRGSQKFARYLGDYIVSNYDFPDRRGDPQYSSWERHADFIRQMIYNQELVETVDKSVLCEKVKEGNYWTIVSADGECNNSELVHTKSLQALGIDDKDATGM